MHKNAKKKNKQKNAQLYMLAASGSNSDKNERNACLIYEAVFFFFAAVTHLCHRDLCGCLLVMLNALLQEDSHVLCLLLCLFFSGWFCVSAAWNSQPFDLDNYTNANCLCPATSTGGRCQVGFYCPLGSPEPLPCPPGAFCNLSGI